MEADNSFMIAILDTVTQETSVIIAKDQNEMRLLFARLSDHHTVLSVQNMGVVITADDFLRQLTDDGNMNFGSY